MSKSQTQHALSIVDTFKSKLSQSGVEHVGAKHFNELALLIEAAIDSAVFSEMEVTADRVSQLAHEIRSNAEKFD